MDDNSINYNKIAGNYDNRYNDEKNSGIAAELNDIIGKNKYARISEIGCGTGYWLKNINVDKRILAGIDSSIEMLKIAKIKNCRSSFICAKAEKLPIRNASLDFIFCVNAIHQFQNKKGFINSAVSLLKPNGTFAVIGVFPASNDYKWYLYDYFPGVYEYDLQRFPTEKELLDIFVEEKLSGISLKKIYTVSKTYFDSDVFKDSFLERNGCSQLAMLSDVDYELGIDKIKEHIKEMNAKNERAIFTTNIQYKIIIGKK